MNSRHIQVIRAIKVLIHAVSITHTLLEELWFQEKFDFHLMVWHEIKRVKIIHYIVTWCTVFIHFLFEWWKGEGNFPHDGNLKFSFPFFFCCFSCFVEYMCDIHMEGWREGGNVYWVWNSHYAIFPHTYRHVILYICSSLHPFFLSSFSNLFTHKMKFFLCWAQEILTNNWKFQFLWQTPFYLDEIVNM